MSSVYMTQVIQEMSKVSQQTQRGGSQEAAKQPAGDCKDVVSSPAACLGLFVHWIPVQSQLAEGPFLTQLHK